MKRNSRTPRSFFWAVAISASALLGGCATTGTVLPTGTADPTSLSGCSPIDDQVASRFLDHEREGAILPLATECGKTVQIFAAPALQPARKTMRKECRPVQVDAVSKVACRNVDGWKLSSHASLEARGAVSPQASSYLSRDQRRQAIIKEVAREGKLLESKMRTTERGRSLSQPVLQVN